jgi:uncharacterized membrane protein YdbT with pleckstrin-like domain
VEFVGYVETVLEPGEQIIHRAHLHWIVYWRAVVLLLIGGALYVSDPVEDLLEGMMGLGEIIGLVLIVLAAVSFLRAAIDRWTTEIAVTSQRVILKRGLIRRDTIEINMPKVESVDVQQSILGRLLDFGTVIVRGTGGSFNPLAHVWAPLPLRRAVRLAGQTTPNIARP